MLTSSVTYWACPRGQWHEQRIVSWRRYDDRGEGEGEERKRWEKEGREGTAVGDSMSTPESSKKQ